jgi:hypothetical protein
MLCHATGGLCRPAFVVAGLQTRRHDGRKRTWNKFPPNLSI